MFAAHNARFDRNFLAEEIERAGIDRFVSDYVGGPTLLVQY